MRMYRCARRRCHHVGAQKAMQPGGGCGIERTVSQRPSLPASQVSPEAAAKMGDFHPEVIREVEAAVKRDAIVVIGMAQNPHVKNVRKALGEAKIPFSYLEYGSYLSEWRKRLAIKLWSGWPTFPQVFV